MSSGDRYLASVLAAVFFHAGALALLSSAEEDDEEEDDDITEVVLEAEPEPPKPEPPEPEPPKPEPEPEPEPKPVIAKALVKPEPKQIQPKNAEPKRTPPPIEPDDVNTEVAGGDPSLPAPGGVFKMEDVVPGGTAMGGVGTSKASGKGGSGTGTDKGGDGGTGKGNAKPVSIASIKKKAKPINNRDIIGDRRFNDVEGNVVVKLVVDASGKVTKTTLIKRLKPEVDSVALAWAKKLRFEPALDQDDKPVTSVVNWTFTFRPPT